MKRLSLLFSILLIAWITIASYWYTCKIRVNCGDGAQATLAGMAEPEAAVEPAEDAKITPEKDSIALALEFLEAVGTKKYYFEFASTQLNTESDEEDYFTTLAYLLEHKTGSSVKIVGHACNRGSAEANERFSKLRAERVKQHFVEKGLAADKLILEWEGDREPAASNETEDGRKLNRRVEISINP